MKRKGFLIEQIADPENIRLAFLKAKKGKSSKKSVLEFGATLDEQVMSLRTQILKGQVEVGKYHLFMIYDPKKRQICAADFKERVLHHAIMNICHDDFEQHQVYHSYASRKRKGVYKCLEQALKNHKKYAWYLKMDCRKYFYSIDHGIVKQQLERVYKDGKLLNIFSQIIATYEAKSNSGLPIGNLISQYLANHYLSVADHFASEKLGIKAYVRYMDDIVIWGNDKKELLQKAIRYKAFLKRHLKLEIKPFSNDATHNELSFLGYLVSKNKLYLAKRSRKRFKRLLRKNYTALAMAKFSEKEFSLRMTACTSFVAHADTYHFRKKQLSKYE